MHDGDEICCMRLVQCQRTGQGEAGAVADAARGLLYSVET